LQGSQPQASAENVIPLAKCGVNASIKREYHFGDFFDKGLVVAVLSSQGIVLKYDRQPLDSQVDSEP
jgi:hypothetical protein